MKIEDFRKYVLIFAVTLLLQTASLRGQSSPPLTVSGTDGSGNAVDFEFRADGTLIAKGNLGVGSLLSTDQALGAKLLWYPAQGAFRAGIISNEWNPNAWSASNIGLGTAAFGQDTTASANYSTAAGFFTAATGVQSVALGAYTTASGLTSTALGQATTASGRYSMATDFASTASGYASMASGKSTSAGGGCSNAFGIYTTATGNESSASGYATVATACDDFVIGSYNLGGGNSTGWVSTDPLFEIGNGAPSSQNGWGGPPARSDALVVYKNGNATFQGAVTAQVPAGDIPMFTGSN